MQGMPQKVVLPMLFLTVALSASIGATKQATRLLTE